MKPVVLINAFSVPLEESEPFLSRWKENARIMAGQPGLLRATMYRAEKAEAELRFINVAEWATSQALAQAASSLEFRHSAEAMLSDPGLHIVPRPAVYSVAVEVLAGEGLRKPAR